MLKYFLIGLILVYGTLQVEIAPENQDPTSSEQVEAKKFFKHKEWKGHHKKYKGDDDWKEQHEGHGKRHRGEDAVKSYDEEKKHYSGKSKKYHKEGKVEQVRREVPPMTVEMLELATVEPADLPRDTEVNARQQPVDLSHDIDVNKKAPRPADPQSELAVPIRKDFYKDMKKIDLSSPPDANDTTLMARYIVHNVDWAAMATVTTRSGAKHAPFANVLSMSDGPVEQGSGVPFFYVTLKDLSTQDLAHDNKASVTVTLAQTDYCRNKALDPEDPRCARVILSGKVKRVKPETNEETFAINALFTRHPVMKTWPKDHNFYIAKLKIGQIILLDQFGGPKYLDVEQYLQAGTTK